MANATTIGTALRELQRLFSGGGVASMTDAQLLGQFVERGDEAAFGVLVARHGPMVLSVCRGVLHDPLDAEDAFQATFLILVRKGGSLWVGDSIGGWLHRVASRVSRQANVDASRRRAEEAKAMHSESPRTELGEDVRRVLHEEIARLPERFRLPVVLSDLEGLTHLQVASQLHCGEATVRRRLAEARVLLKSRLTRRGLAPSGVLAVSSLAKGASAVVPEPWTSATVRAAASWQAMGGTVPSTTVALARRTLKAMALSRLRVASTLGLALSGTASLALSLGLGLASADTAPEAHGRVSSVKSAPPVAAQNEAPATPAPADASESVTCVGRVLDPSGKPLARARLYLVYHSNRTTLPPPSMRSTTGLGGEFRFSIPRAELEATVSRDTSRAAQIVAVAEGYGPAWADVSEFERSDEAKDLTLVVDDVPILGRILDLEGRPVAGATIRVEQTSVPPGGDLSLYLPDGREKRGVGILPKLEFRRGVIPGQPESVTTDAQGRFRLVGIGRDRMVWLWVCGARIQNDTFHVMTRNGPNFVGKGRLAKAPSTTYAATFEHSVLPGRTLVGVVRDRETGKPLVGVEVLGSGPHAVATTDGSGRYELTGAPKSKEYMVYVRPAERGHPYFNSKFMFEDTPGLGPIQADVALRRGIPLNLRVVDGETGASLPGAVVYYEPLFPNPNVRPESSFGLYTPAYPQPDGTYLGVAWPGPAAICVRASADIRSLTGRFMRVPVDPRPFFDAKPDDTTQAFGDGKSLIVVSPGGGPQKLPQSQFHVIVPINPAADAPPLHRVIPLAVGKTLSVEILGRDGTPLTGARVEDREAQDGWGRPLKTPVFQVTGLNPLHPRSLVIEHESEKLAAVLVARGDERGPVRIRLRPWGSANGRLLVDGKPKPGVRLRAVGFSNDEPSTPHVGAITSTDAEGRFVADRLIDGLRYTMEVHNSIAPYSGEVVGQTANGPAIQAGTRVDLGDVPMVPLPRVE